MTENPTPPAPQMIGREVLAAWSVTPTRHPDEDDASRIGVGAITARMAGPDGLADVPAVELVVPPALVDDDGVLRWDAETASVVAEHMARAARVARRGVAR